MALSVIAPPGSSLSRTRWVFDGHSALAQNFNEVWDKEGIIKDRILIWNGYNIPEDIVFSAS